jgi:hypothetical protein
MKVERREMRRITEGDSGKKGGVREIQMKGKRGERREGKKEIQRKKNKLEIGE